MVKTFATTRNVRAFYAGMEAVDPANNKGRAEMALVCGVYGTGKTETSQKFVADNDHRYIRAKAHTSPRSLLAEIVAELGERPKYRADALFEQATEQLLEQPRTLVVDEVDYLLDDARAIETLRDLYDWTNCPVVLVGMKSDIDKRIKAKLPHLADRWGAIVRFSSFTVEDVAEIAGQLCEVKFDNGAIEWLTRYGEGRFRPLQRWFRTAEKTAKTNGLETITAAHLDQLRARNQGRKEARR